LSYFATATAKTTKIPHTKAAAIVNTTVEACLVHFLPNLQQQQQH